MTKRFTITIETTDPKTRWLTGWKLLGDLFLLALVRILQTNTRGPTPRLTITEDQ